MRPHSEDQRHNKRIGFAFRQVVQDAYSDGCSERQVDERIGQQVNILIQHAYDLGAREAVQPRPN
jgi:hypothetical protein